MKTIKTYWAVLRNADNEGHNDEEAFYSKKDLKKFLKDNPEWEEIEETK